MATEEQSQAVNRILKSKTLYDCLNVKKDASTQEITKQYKRLSILVHPDRNPHPQSSEAFKRINEAKIILTDEYKRKYYDLTGSTTSNIDRDRQYQTADKPFVFYSSERVFTDEELFQFFNNAEFFTFQTHMRRPFRTQNSRSSFTYNTRTHQRDHRSYDDDGEFKTLFPLIILFFLFIVYNFGVCNSYSK